MKKKNKKLIRNIVILVLIAGLVYFIIPKKSDEVSEVKYLEYTVEKGNLETSYNYTGTINSDNETLVKSLESQKIEEIRIEEGDLVTSNTVLFVNDEGDRVYPDGFGTVDTIYVNEGQEVQSGTNLVLIKDYTDMEVSISVDEYDIFNISEGDEVEITVNATDEFIYGTVEKISTTAKNYNSLAYFDVDIKIDPTDKVKVGMNVEVNIIQNRVTDVPVLTMNAVNTGLNNTAYVLVKDASGNMVERNVELGMVQGNNVEVISGLNVGDVVYYTIKNQMVVANDSIVMPPFPMGGSSSSSISRPISRPNRG